MIPKIIMQTGKDNNHSEEVLKAMQSWKDLNPKYEYIYFSNKECEEFLIKHYNKDIRLAFRLLIPGAVKADFFRYCYLYIKGGIYTDLDNICKKPLDEWINCDLEEFVSILDIPYIAKDPNPDSFMPIIKHDWIYQAFLATRPNNEIFERLINHMTINTLNKTITMEPMHDNVGTWWAPHPCFVTMKLGGPKLIADIVNQYIGMPVGSPFNLGKIPTEKMHIRFAGKLVNKQEKSNAKIPQTLQNIVDYKHDTIMDVKYDGFDPGKDHYGNIRFPNELYNYKIKKSDLK